MTKQQQEEWLVCAESFLYWCATYVQIYDATAGEWLSFVLWKAQAGVVRTLLTNLLVVILKARQVGLTWLVLAFGLWLMLFFPAATILLFSKRDNEAIDLLDFRLKGMYERLPEWMKCESVVTDNDHEWQLSNGSRALSFPTTGGRSYTATMVIVDEADFIPDLGAVLSATQPTIDAGGRMVILSSANKLTPLSRFKELFREAHKRTVKWVAVFLAWDVAPWRTKEWHAQKKSDALRIERTLDDFSKEYPTTWTEALSPATKDKRIPYEWLEANYVEMDALDSRGFPRGAPSIERLKIFRLPVRGRKYIIGADPAEGNPTSDDSALELLDYETGEEMASLAEKLQPEILASHIDTLGKFYNNAHVLVERNNHGGTVLSWLREHSKLMRLKGHDGKDGWHTTAFSKTRMYDVAATAFREGETILHDSETFTQLSLIQGASLEAPEGMMDDRATAYAVALAGRNRKYTSLGDVTSGMQDQANKWSIGETRTDARISVESDERSRWEL